MQVACRVLRPHKIIRCLKTLGEMGWDESPAQSHLALGRGSKALGSARCRSLEQGWLMDLVRSGREEPQTRMQGARWGPPIHVWPGALSPGTGGDQAGEAGEGVSPFSFLAARPSMGDTVLGDQTLQPLIPASEIGLVLALRPLSNLSSGWLRRTFEGWLASPSPSQLAMAHRTPLLHMPRAGITHRAPHSPNALHQGRPGSCE